MKKNNSNKFIEKLKNSVIDASLFFIFKFWVKLKVENLENIEKTDDPIVFISNHLSNFDAIALNQVLRDRDVYYISGIKLNSDRFTSFFKSYLKTIDIKPDTPDVNAIREIINKLNQNKNILIFPEGTRSRNATLAEGKKGILLILKKTRAKIIPLSITGTENVLPINSEGKMYKEKIKKGLVKVVVGSPFSLPEKKDDMGKREYEDFCMDFLMKKISVNLPESYKGIYK